MLLRPAWLEDSKVPRGLEGWARVGLLLFEFAMVVGVGDVDGSGSKGKILLSKELGAENKLQDRPCGWPEFDSA